MEIINSILPAKDAEWLISQFERNKSLVEERIQSLYGTLGSKFLYGLLEKESMNLKQVQQEENDALEKSEEAAKKFEAHRNKAQPDNNEAKQLDAEIKALEEKIHEEEQFIDAAMYKADNLQKQTVTKAAEIRSLKMNSKLEAYKKISGVEFIEWSETPERPIIEIAVNSPDHSCRKIMENVDWVWQEIMIIDANP